MLNPAGDFFPQDYYFCKKDSVFVFVKAGQHNKCLILFYIWVGACFYNCVFKRNQFYSVVQLKQFSTGWSSTPSGNLWLISPTEGTWLFYHNDFTFNIHGEHTIECSHEGRCQSEYCGICLTKKHIVFDLRTDLRMACSNMMTHFISVYQRLDSSSRWRCL